MVYYGFLLLLKLQPKNGKKQSVISPQIFWPKKICLDLKFSKIEKFLKKIGGNMAVLIFFLVYIPALKKNLCANFLKKIPQIFFSHTFFHILSGFDQIPMKNTLSIAICSLKLKKSPKI